MAKSKNETKEMNLDFSAFLAGNANQISEVHFVASKRFMQGDKPVEWILKPIDSQTEEAIRKSCTKQVEVTGKRGYYQDKTDMDAYLAKMCVASTAFPPLNNVELQNSYGVMGGEALLKKLLHLPGEYTEYKAKVMEVNGFDTGMGQLVADAKN